MSSSAFVGTPRLKAFVKKVISEQAAVKKLQAKKDGLDEALKSIMMHYKDSLVLDEKGALPEVTKSFPAPQHRDDYDEEKGEWIRGDAERTVKQYFILVKSNHNRNALCRELNKLYDATCFKELKDLDLLARSERDSDHRAIQVPKEIFEKLRDILKLIQPPEIVSKPEEPVAAPKPDLVSASGLRFG